ncbi:MAG: hypothetical protein SOW25_00235 [Helicobacter sp.]|nr:hypothetical protein [Helicobacteraceae bacterium]MDY3112738.1 hypothetical protein [Helicobacter sp.]
MQTISFFKAFQTCKNGEKIPFIVSFEKATLEGFLSHSKNHYDLLKLQATLKGEITLICDLSGDEYQKKLDESLEFYLSDGIKHLDNGEFLDIFECEKGNIDFLTILKSELEIIRCDYHTKEY